MDPPLHARIRARCRCPNTRSRPCTRTQKWELGSCVYTIFVSSGQTTALFYLLSSCFKMASDRAKWSNYVHSHISGTQSVNTTPFCAGTQTLVSENQDQSIRSIYSALYIRDKFMLVINGWRGGP